MARTYNVYEAKTHFSRILEQVAAGEEVVVAKAGHPVARIVPIGRREPRVPGRHKGLYTMAPDFDDLPEDIAAAFRGERP